MKYSPANKGQIAPRCEGSLGMHSQGANWSSLAIKNLNLVLARLYGLSAVLASPHIIHGKCQTMRHKKTRHDSRTIKVMWRKWGKFEPLLAGCLADAINLLAHC